MFLLLQINSHIASSLSLRGILDANKLAGLNYIDWLKNLRIVLIQEKVSYILNTPAPDSLGEDAFKEDWVAYKIQKDDSMTVKCIMLVSMSKELQKQHEDIDVFSILLNLKELYGEQSQTARYDISKQLFLVRMTEGSFIQMYFLKMIDLITYLG